MQGALVLGGLGQLVGSCIAEAGIACKLVSRGCPDYFVPIANPEFLYARNGMDADGIRASIGADSAVSQSMSSDRLAR